MLGEFDFAPRVKDWFRLVDWEDEGQTFGLACAALLNGALLIMAVWEKWDDTEISDGFALNGCIILFLLSIVFFYCYTSGCKRYHLLRTEYDDAAVQRSVFALLALFMHVCV
eukprot:Opistho-2@76192